ncbi:MAG TPA: zinc ribbon domain-containing protein [bacterium]|jgi:ribosomal protein L40E|nr:zinc ribbon domain-containing protein [bacterium]HPL22229.1 zinc ribbon domain-containing protein [bacterium]
MDCLKCGFDLPENSKFCPKCGEKVVIPKKEEAKSDKSVCEEINNHLEFLGYKISKEEMSGEQNKSKYIYSCIHPKLNNIVFYKILDNLILFRVNLTTKKKETNEMLKYANVANDKSLNVCKVFIKLDDDKKAQISFEAIYTGHYSKEIFSEFFNEFVDDQKRFYVGDNFDKIFID